MTYENLAEQIVWHGLTQEELLEVADYLPGKNWMDVHRVWVFFRVKSVGHDHLGANLLAQELRSVIVMKVLPGLAPVPA